MSCFSRWQYLSLLSFWGLYIFNCHSEDYIFLIVILRSKATVRISTTRTVILRLARSSRRYAPQDDSKPWESEPYIHIVILSEKNLRIAIFRVWESQQKKIWNFSKNLLKSFAKKIILYYTTYENEQQEAIFHLFATHTLPVSFR